jgi:NADH-quinone oxidoreductase subunit A
VTEYYPALALMALVMVGVVGLYGITAVLAPSRHALRSEPFLAGQLPSEHAISRFHLRWYAITLIFLAFDMEMVFMYPWGVVFLDTGIKALIEGLVFLGLLTLGIVYAWREGGLRWQ